MNPTLHSSPIPRRTLCLLVIGLLATSYLTAGDRIALVLGNNSYQHARALNNPVNDATAMAGMLQNLGFGVTLRVDADLKTTKAALREFIDALPKERDPDAVALVYFAGHGVQINGRNYLIPVDAAMEREYEVPDETVAMDSIMSALEAAGAGLNLLVLDCCRDDPFARSWKGTRSSGTAGLAVPGGAPQGMFIAFSTSPGDVALDGEGSNSPYAEALLKHLPTPGKPFEEVFKAVGGEVASLTSGDQEPWFNSKFYGNFRFVDEGNTLPTAPVQPGGASKDRPWINSLGLEFIPVPGSPDILMAKTETRVRDFRAYATATGYEATGGAHVFRVKEKPTGGYTSEWVHEPSASWASHGFAQTEDHPVVCVSWDDANAFCEWLSRKEGMTYRLPRDAEWSAAVKNGARFPWGDQWPLPASSGNYWDTSAVAELPGNWQSSIVGGAGYNDGVAKTSRVGTYPANLHGFLDLGGNVWEWVENGYLPTMNPPDILAENSAMANPEAPKGGRPHKTLRGGSWDNYSQSDLRSDIRDYEEPTRRDDDYGFRIVVEIPR
jgi:formylglycine-generating enzyme required for sulfatase activity